jgi:hypothetical protein
MLSMKHKTHNYDLYTANNKELFIELTLKEQSLLSGGAPGWFKVHRRWHCEKCKGLFGLTRTCRCRCQNKVCDRSSCGDWFDSGEGWGWCVTS